MTTNETKTIITNQALDQQITDVLNSMLDRAEQMEELTYIREQIILKKREVRLSVKMTNDPVENIRQIKQQHKILAELERINERLTKKLKDLIWNIK